MPSAPGRLPRQSRWHGQGLSRPCLTSNKVIDTMSKAVNLHTASRRGLLATSSAVLALSSAAVAAPSARNPNAELIQVCQRFAEAEYADWYLYATTDDREIERQSENRPVDWATVRWIEATPAHTLAGHQAKALACAAWDRDAYDSSADDNQAFTGLLASLLRDLAAPARAVILARLAEQYGPLPDGYDADCRWIGRAAA